MLQNATPLNQHLDLRTSLMNMSLVLRLPRKMHLCRSSSKVPRRRWFFVFPQTTCPPWSVLLVGIKAGAWSGCSICKLSHKMALVPCPCAFRLGRLAQNGCPGPEARHFSRKLSHQITRPCAFRLPRLAHGHTGALGLRHFHCNISHKRAPVEILLTSSLSGPRMILYGSWTEDLVEIPVRSCLRGPCTRRLQMSCLRGACEKALVGGSWEVLA